VLSSERATEMLTCCPGCGLWLSDQLGGGPLFEGGSAAEAFEREAELAIAGFVDMWFRFAAAYLSFGLTRPELEADGTRLMSSSPMRRGTSVSGLPSSSYGLVGCPCRPPAVRPNTPEASLSAEFVLLG
jgi:hypothetical protein